MSAFDNLDVSHPPDLSKLLSDAEVGLATYDPDGRLLSANEHLCHIVGRTADELRKLKFTDFTHPDDLVWNVPLYENAKRQREALHVEKRYVRPSGEVRWCAVSVDFTDRPGSAAETVVVVNDISLRREAEENAERNRTLLQTVIDSISDLVFVKDVQGRFIMGNRALRDALGDLIGSNVEDHFDPQLAAHYSAADDHVLRLGASSSVDETIPVKGVNRTFNTVKTPWYQDGRIAGLVGISHDITDRLEAQRELKRREEQYRLAARATNDTIWDWNFTNDTVEWNDAAKELFREPAQPSNDWWLSRIHPEDVGRVKRSIMRYVEHGGDTWREEYRICRADQSVAYVLDRGFLLRDDEGRAVRMIGAMTDLTERQETQARLNQLQAELIHVSRVSAMGTMASALAHELNQPLTAINNYLSGAQRLLRANTPDALSVTADVLGRAATESLRAGEIIRRLRSMVAKGRAETQTIDVRAILMEARAIALPDQQLAMFDVDFDVADGLIARGDPIQVQQVVLNLIRNAAEAMSDQRLRQLLIRGTRAVNEIILSVEDSGPGFAPEVAESLFTPFVSTKTSGLGVGLSICRTIIESHGGRIWAEASSLGGAKMCFSLRAEDGFDHTSEGAPPPRNMKHLQLFT